MNEIKELSNKGDGVILKTISLVSAFVAVWIAVFTETPDIRLFCGFVVLTILVWGAIENSILYEIQGPFTILGRLKCRYQTILSTISCGFVVGNFRHCVPPTICPTELLIN